VSVPEATRRPLAVVTSLVMVAGLSLTTSGAIAATEPRAVTGVVSVTDLTPAPAAIALTRREVETLTLTFRVTSSDGQALRPKVIDRSGGIEFTGVTSALVSGDRTDGIWESTLTLASFMDGNHHPRVRVCTAEDSCISRALATTVIVNGSDWPTLTRITQSPRRLSAGDVKGAVAQGRVVFSDSRDPVSGMRVRLLRHIGKVGQLVDSTNSRGEFTAPWPWTLPGQDPARVFLLSPKVSGAPFDRAVLGNPDTRFHVLRPHAKVVASIGKRYVVRGTITPGYPASQLGGIRLQQRTSSGWITRDVSQLRQVRSDSGTVLNRARYRLSTSFGTVGKRTMRVLKPSAMCRDDHCRVAQNHSRRFSVVAGNRTYFVERRLHALGVPVGDVDGQVDVRARQAFCAWRDMTGRTPDRRGLTKSLVRSILNHSKLPAPHRTNGIYINKTCQVLFQVKHHSFRRIVWVSTGTAGYETPNGTGHIFRKVKGWVESSLYPGAYMLDPMYFLTDRPGIALHGSASNDLVKPYPASHGCVRVWRPQIRKIFEDSPLGTKVKVYGSY
jgi:hypothetical protein